MKEEIAPDGSPVLLYLALSGDDEAGVVHAAIPAGATVLELGCGVGRVSRALVTMGHAVTGVDNSPEMLSHATEIDTILADITTLDLRPRRWPVVLMASHFVNDELGPTFLAAAARHVSDDGFVIVQRYAPGWVDTVEPSERERDGIRITIRDVARPQPGTVDATIVYELQGRQFEQRFTAHEISDTQLEAMAEPVGLTIDAVLDEPGIWIRLRRVAR